MLHSRNDYQITGSAIGILTCQSLFFPKMNELINSPVAASVDTFSADNNSLLLTGWKQMSCLEHAVGLRH